MAIAVVLLSGCSQEETPGNSGKRPLELQAVIAADGSRASTTLQTGATSASVIVKPNQTFAADGNVEGVTLAATQRATIGSFDRNAALMMARSDTKKLSFRNAVGFVKFTLGFACKQIELQGGSGEIIAGKATLAYNNGEPALTFTSEQSTSIILNPATDGGERKFW